MVMYDETSGECQVTHEENEKETYPAANFRRGKLIPDFSGHGQSAALLEAWQVLVRLCRNSEALAIDVRGLEVRRWAAASAGGATLPAWRRHGERRSARRHRTRRPSARHHGIGRVGRRQRHAGSIPAHSAILVLSRRGVFGGTRNARESAGNFRHCPAMSPSCRASI